MVFSSASSSLAASATSTTDPAFRYAACRFAACARSISVSGTRLHGPAWSERESEQGPGSHLRHELRPVGQCVCVCGLPDPVRPVRHCRQVLCACGPTPASAHRAVSSRKVPPLPPLSTESAGALDGSPPPPCRSLSRALALSLTQGLPHTHALTHKCGLAVSESPSAAPQPKLPPRPWAGRWRSRSQPGPSLRTAPAYVPLQWRLMIRPMSEGTCASPESGDS